MIGTTVSHEEIGNYLIFHNCIPCYGNETLLALNVQQLALHE